MAKEIFGVMPILKTDEKERRKDIKVMLKDLNNAREVIVNPPEPFNTDELILESSRKLEYDAHTTMRLAEELYRRGLITYPRTESHEVDQVGLRIAREYLDSIGQGHLYVGRTYKASETYPHVAIRPTTPTDAETILSLIHI
ncbi:MAG: DNA topoisomerase, partial [Thermofilaceae archaeon]|nr:DNA topoisomerase [Thermofilaceae archaeon]